MTEIVICNRIRNTAEHGMCNRDSKRICVILTQWIKKCGVLVCSVLYYGVDVNDIKLSTDCTETVKFFTQIKDMRGD